MLGASCQNLRLPDCSILYSLMGVEEADTGWRLSEESLAPLARVRLQQQHAVRRQLLQHL